MIYTGLLRPLFVTPPCTYMVSAYTLTAHYSTTWAGDTQPTEKLVSGLVIFDERSSHEDHGFVFLGSQSPYRAPTRRSSHLDTALQYRTAFSL